MSSTYPPAVAHRAFGSKAVRVGRLGATAASSTVSPAWFLVSDESKVLAVFCRQAIAPRSMARPVRIRHSEGYSPRSRADGIQPLPFRHAGCGRLDAPVDGIGKLCIARSPVASTAVMFRRRRMATGDMSLIWLVGVVTSQR